MTRPELVRNWIIYWGVVVGLFVGGTVLFMGCDVATAAEWEDLGVVHKTLIAEAGGEGIEGMVAVANVIRNRSIKRSLTPEQVVKQRLQFSCWNNGEGQVDRMLKRNRSVWDDALTAWQLSWVEDVTGGADHYFADYIKRPVWAKNMTFSGRVGKHLFYRS